MWASMLGQMEGDSVLRQSSTSISSGCEKAHCSPPDDALWSPFVLLFTSFFSLGSSLGSTASGSVNLNLFAARSPSSMSLGGTSHLNILHEFAGTFQDNLLKGFCNLDALAAFLGLG